MIDYIQVPLAIPDVIVQTLEAEVKAGSTRVKVVPSVGSNNAHWNVTDSSGHIKNGDALRYGEAILFAREFVFKKEQARLAHIDLNQSLGEDV